MECEYCGGADDGCYECNVVQAEGEEPEVKPDDKECPF